MHLYIYINTAQDTEAPSEAASSRPSEIPSSVPSVSPSDQPSSQPSVSPSGQPSFSPSSQPSSSPSNQPSSQPSSQPSVYTYQPSSMPSSQLSYAPSNQPSSQPSFRPSSQPSSPPTYIAPSYQPSSKPSNSPSSMPSESPTSMPSSQPSDTPSCTPSSAPTPSPSINLFYPGQSSDANGCKNDGDQPAWMDSNPSFWLFTTLEKCCESHFGWNLQTCLGTHPQECAKTLWYPDWLGSNTGCLRDGNEPLYMIQSPADFIFSDRRSCCEEHYPWGFDVCMGLSPGSCSYVCTDNSGTATSSASSSGVKYYADWLADVRTCKNDGLAPQYMVDQASLWLYDDLDSCCERFFSYKLDFCKGGGGTSSYTGTNKWYVSYDDKTCFKDCEIKGTDCGGPPNYFGSNNLFDSKAKCCKEHLWYDYKNCMRA
eukprot:scaffold52698_cov55-Cyclotella_meneghiniana.AAC.2